MAQRAAVDTSLKEVQSKISEQEQNVALIRSPKYVIEMPPEALTQVASLKQRERVSPGKAYRNQQNGADRAWGNPGCGRLHQEGC